MPSIRPCYPVGTSADFTLGRLRGLKVLVARVRWYTWRSHHLLWMAKAATAPMKICVRDDSRAVISLWWKHICVAEPAFSIPTVGRPTVIFSRVHGRGRLLREIMRVLQREKA